MWWGPNPGPVTTLAVFGPFTLRGFAPNRRSFYDRTVPSSDVEYVRTSQLRLQEVRFKACILLRLIILRLFTLYLDLPSKRRGLLIPLVLASTYKTLTRPRHILQGIRCSLAFQSVPEYPYVSTGTCPSELGTVYNFALGLSYDRGSQMGT